jgi:hypothetical protein
VIEAWPAPEQPQGAVEENERLKAENTELLRRLDRWEAGLRATEGLRAVADDSDAPRGQ